MGKSNTRQEVKEKGYAPGAIYNKQWSEATPYSLFCKFIVTHKFDKIQVTSKLSLPLRGEGRGEG